MATIAQIDALHTYQDQLKYLEELWTIPRHRKLISGEKYLEANHPGFPTEGSERNFKTLVNNVREAVGQYRTRNRAFDKRTFVERTKAFTMSACHYARRDIHKDVSYQIIWRSHAKTAEITKSLEYGNNTIRFIIPTSWYLTAGVCQAAIRGNEEMYLFEYAKLLGKSGDGHAMYHVRGVDVEYKPKSTGFDVVKRTDSYFTFDPLSKNYAWGATFLKARDNLRKKVAKTVTQTLEQW
jgi:hypothetical protein